MTNYIRVLELGFQDVECYATDPADYSTIVRVSGPPLPTKAELDEYAESNVTLTTSKISSEKISLFFGIKTAGAKNFWLNTLFSDGSTLGYYIPNNCILRKVTVSLKETVDIPITLKIRKTGYGTILANVVIPENTKNYSDDSLSFIIPADIQISCYLESTKIVKDNVVILDLYSLTGL